MKREWHGGMLHLIDAEGQRYALGNLQTRWLAVASRSDGSPCGICEYVDAKMSRRLDSLVASSRVA